MKKNNKTYSNRKGNLAKYLLFLFLAILLLGGIYYVSKIANGESSIFPPTGWKQEETEYVTPATGDTIFLKGLYVNEEDQNKLIPIAIDEEKITLSADGLFLQEGEEIGKGIDLNGCKPQIFTIMKGSRAELSTCTMDMGASWFILYMDNGSLKIVTTTWSGL